jgi:sterol 3beta-glucosyltransferase
VVAPPLDYPDWIRITGYWFLNEGTDWTPPTELSNFIAQAFSTDSMTVLVRAEGSETTIDPNPMYTSFLPSDLAV